MITLEIFTEYFSKKKRNSVLRIKLPQNQLWKILRNIFRKTNQSSVLQNKVSAKLPQK